MPRLALIPLQGASRVAIVLTLSCATSAGPTILHLEPIPHISCDPIDGTVRYFPPGAVETNCAYTGDLIRLREKALWPAQSGIQAYRFLWIRSFFSLIAIRVEDDNGGNHVLTAKQVQFKFASNDPNAVQTEDLLTIYSHKLSAAEWGELQRLLREANVWNISVKPDPKFIQVDGAHWVFEASVHGNYHVADVWSPRADGPHASFRRLCLYLLSISGFKVHPNFIF